ncbi:NAD(P)H-quinone oxidoreductase subunit 3 [Planctomycetes bacterium Pan216]|uniref:NADH-quinone oxidoreductase subunit n=1 Tax=Kolteria novifilia TaxID=2527975 RepID=A0A518B4N3_9BACT|nr:NAD(P)H-quinone oxidoreductase subunit 3 [Planctomycetes bacterium Pan216]
MDYFSFRPVLFTGALFLFAAVAIGMLLAPLLLGWFLRPHNPSKEKGDIYECGEPTIGGSDAQFDIRFYVVALLFIVFDVEIAFFFPWAVVFGKATTLAKSTLSEGQRQHVSAALLGEADVEAVTPVAADAAGFLQRVALMDLLVFFGVVLVGFAYVWKRGDLDWVRAMARERAVKTAAGDGPPSGTKSPSLSV